LYSKDSDVFLPYGPSTVDEYKRRLANEKENGLSIPAAIKNKTKLVAWVVSHCDAMNGRNRYVEELKKHISVDIYGKCGPLKCDSKSSNEENLNPPTGCCKLPNLMNDLIHELIWFLVILLLMIFCKILL
jgi:hypothetical protein